MSPLLLHLISCLLQNHELKISIMLWHKPSILHNMQKKKKNLLFPEYSWDLFVFPGWKERPFIFRELSVVALSSDPAQSVEDWGLRTRQSNQRSENILNQQSLHIIAHCYNPLHRTGWEHRTQDWGLFGDATASASPLLLLFCWLTLLWGTPRPHCCDGCWNTRPLLGEGEDTDR